MRVAAGGPPPTPRAAARPQRFLAGSLMVATAVFGLMALPGASRAVAASWPDGVDVARAGAGRVESSVPAEDRDPAVTVSPSRDLDAAGSLAIAGVAGVTVAAGVVVLRELRRRRHPEAAEPIADGVPAGEPVDVDALIAAASKPERAARRRTRNGPVPVWVARLDPEAIAPSAEAENPG